MIDESASTARNGSGVVDGGRPVTAALLARLDGLPQMSAGASLPFPAPLRAPVESGVVLARPLLSEAEALLAANRERFAAAQEVDLQGRTWRRLREWTRREVLTQAHAYTQELIGQPCPPPDPAAPCIVSGHQPAPTHPGVWAKHFAIAGLARRMAGSGLNLIVDNDLLPGTTLLVPRGPRETPHLEAVPFLEPTPRLPWEEALVGDSPTFASFGRRVSESISSDWGYRPLIDTCWPDALHARATFQRVGDCLSAMRRRQESRFGAENLELPLSRVEELPPFRWFAAHLMAHAERFRAVHNEVLGDYRRRHRIRSRSHPVPELRAEGEWTEVPLWVWRQGETQRAPLLVRPEGRRLLLAREAGPVGVLRLHREGEACCAVEDLAALSTQGWRIRTRALTTTLFARLCLADLFVHGIGGAVYDELTDRIVRQFWGMEPPAFLTLTATWHLPLSPFPVTSDDLDRLRRRLRELLFNADRVLTGEEAAVLAQEKHRLIAEANEARARRHAAGPRWSEGAADRRRHQRLREIGHRLASLAAPQIEQTRAALEQVQRQLDANRILRSREFAWCLFPESALEALARRLTRG